MKEFSYSKEKLHFQYNSIATTVKSKVNSRKINEKNQKFHMNRKRDDGKETFNRKKADLIPHEAKERVFNKMRSQERPSN